MDWTIFGVWILVYWGLLWVMRHTYGRLECNFFSSAIAAALFLGIFHLLSQIQLLLEKAPDLLQVAYFLDSV